MKLLAFGDLHFSSKPLPWLQASPAETLASLMIAAIARYTPDAVLLPGDVLDSPRVGNEASIALARAINSTNAQFVATLGQHDVRSHRIDDFERDSDLAVVAEASDGRLRILHSGESMSLGDTVVYGFGWGQPATDELLAGEFVFAKTRKQIVALAHASVGEEGHAVTPIDSLPLRGADYAVFGDIHAGFDMRVHPRASGRETLSVNCGALLPRKADEYDHWNPTCCLIDTDENAARYERIAEAKEIVHLELVAERRRALKESKRAVSIEEFSEYLRTARSRTQLTDEELVEKVAKELGTPPAAVRMVMECL